MNMTRNRDSVSVAAFTRTEQGKMHVKKMHVKGRYPAILLALFLLAGIAAYTAPRFLVYADKPVKSDAIILFLGNDSSAREKEAHRLLTEGYAGFLIIPADHNVIAHENIPVTSRLSRFKTYPQFYENTHVEALNAKEMMDALGLRSAILVSSPYHMKRIKMICEKTFGGQGRYISYVPTHYENDPVDLRYMAWGDWMFVIREYIKISWFSLYSPFI